MGEVESSPLQELVVGPWLLPTTHCHRCCRLAEFVERDEVYVASGSMLESLSRRVRRVVGKQYGHGGYEV